MKIYDRGMSESSWVPAVIETGRIMNVNIDDWSVDVVSEYANKRYFDIQVMSSYFHYANGEGIYVMPEIGAMVWICKPTQGRFGAPFILGFQSPFDTDNGNFRSGRQSLNPGDIMLRTRDENFIVLRRGGVVQIGATPIAQRMFIPIRNFIKDFCENYELHTFGGDLTWLTDRTDQTTTGDSPTTFSLSAKRLASDPGQVAKLTVGSHGQADPTILKLVIYDSGKEDAKPLITMVLDNLGDVTWTIEKDWNVVAKGDINFESKEGDVSLKSDKGNMLLEAAKTLSLISDTGDIDVTAAGTVKEKSNGHIIEAPEIKLGGAAANDPLVLGIELQSWLKNLLAALQSATCAGNPLTMEASALSSSLDTFLSPVTKSL